MDFVCAALPVLFMLAFVVAIIASMWKLFEKAGQPGWAAIVPFYNNYILTCEIAKKEILWFILMFVPFVNIVAAFIVCMDLAKKFGKEPGFGIGLALLPFVFFPILGFGDAKYVGGRGPASLDDDDYDDRPRKRSKKQADDDDFE